MVLGSTKTISTPKHWEDSEILTSFVMEVAGIDVCWELHELQAECQEYEFALERLLKSLKTGTSTAIVPRFSEAEDDNFRLKCLLVGPM
jgi:hypothetical protein